MPTTLARAQGGDADAFADLIGPHTDYLRLHCYRMLGSLNEAESVLQDVISAAWTSLPKFEGRSTVRTWLYRIATNRCLNTRRDRARQRRVSVSLPFTPPTPNDREPFPFLEPIPDRLLPIECQDPAAASQLRESVELAFIHGLQRLPGRQLAAVVLHDVLGYGRDDVASILDVSPLAVKGLLQRARRTLASDSGTGKPAPSPGSPVEQQVVERFAAALLESDITGLITLLTSDAVLTMPPLDLKYVGSEAIGQFMAASHAWLPERQVELISCRMNTQPAFRHRLLEGTSGEPTSAAVVVLTLSGDQVAGITRFLAAG